MNDLLLGFLCRILASGLATLIYILIRKIIERHKKKMIAKETYHLQVLTGEDIEIIDKVLNDGITCAIYSSNENSVTYENIEPNGVLICRDEVGGLYLLLNIIVNGKVPRLYFIDYGNTWITGYNNLVWQLRHNMKFVVDRELHKVLYVTEEENKNVEK